MNEPEGQSFGVLLPENIEEFHTRSKHNNYEKTRNGYYRFDDELVHFTPGLIGRGEAKGLVRGRGGGRYLYLHVLPDQYLLK